MTEMPGVVTAIVGEQAIVEIGPRTAGCGRCHEPGCCGSPLLGKSGQGVRHYRLPNRVGAGIGDDVVLTLADGSLLKVSLLAYLLPIVLVLGGAAAGLLLLPQSDAASMVGAGIGLAVGLATLRLAQSRMLTRREPLLDMRIKECVFHSHEDIRLC